MAEIPTDLSFKVDKEHWGESFDPANKEQLAQGILNGYIVGMMIGYHKNRREGENLWNTFREDFEDVTIDIFNIARRSALRELREQLVARSMGQTSKRFDLICKGLARRSH
jgi:hypothetical protein